MPRHLNRSELRSWVALIGGVRSLLAALDRQLRDEFGISHDDYQILARLGRSGARPIRMSDLARDVRYSPSRLTHAIDRLESEGWVERAPGEDDARVIEVSLTASGSDWVRGVSDDHLALVETLVFDTLGRERARELGELMREVGQAADGH